MSHPRAIIGDVIKYPEMVMARTVSLITGDQFSYLATGRV